MRRMIDPESVAAVMAHYPRIYFACHTRHVRDPRGGGTLSEHQASVLDHLDDRNPTTLLRLAQHMGVTASTMSLSIKRLLRLGYVARRRDAEDRRAVNLLLTPAGVRVREANSVLDPALVKALLAQLTREERQSALHGLGLLALAADRATEKSGKRNPRSRRRKA